jgi:hypothetical protein
MLQKCPNPSLPLPTPLTVPLDHSVFTCATSFVQIRPRCHLDGAVCRLTKRGGTAQQLATISAQAVVAAEVAAVPSTSHSAAAAAVEAASVRLPCPPVCDASVPEEAASTATSADVDVPVRRSSRTAHWGRVAQRSAKKKRAFKSGRRDAISRLFELNPGGKLLAGKEEQILATRVQVRSLLMQAPSIHCRARILFLLVAKRKHCV